MHELHADGALTDRRCDAFHAAGANVPDCKDARDARLEKERRTWQWPPAEILVIQVGPGLDEALVIERHGAFQPFRVRTRAGHREEVADWQRFGLVRPCVADLHALEVPISLEPHDLLERAHGDIPALLDAADEVPRHRVGKAGPAHENPNGARRGAEKHGRLASRIAAAD